MKELPLEDESEEHVAPKISFHALTGWSTPWTMRVIAHIGNFEVVVLIDSESTHNFISDRVAHLLRLPMLKCL